MRKTIEIELRSDLCAGVGKHYASVIDLDTALDEYGIPFIPARRIKGCLRELADELNCLAPCDLSGLFGERGSASPGSLRITDARIPDYNGQLDEIRTALQSGEVHANDITELFCSVRASTALENDTAKKRTLRFMRAVNRISPVSEEPLRFFADVEFDKAYKEAMDLLCRGLRNIGYKRSRGFGLVKCTLRDPETTGRPGTCTLRDDRVYRLKCLYYLNEDLMLPAADANSTADYIPGSSVLGALAAKYIKAYGEAGFSEVFFSKDVRFGNLYVSDKNGTEFTPAPRFLAKIKAAAKKKGEEGVHNMIANDAAGKDGSRPSYKPLKYGFVNETLGLKTADTEIVYHNALNTRESSENAGGLYTQYCLSSGQYFKGEITAPGAVMKKLLPLFSEGSLCFGRSKTAQYSHCLVMGLDPIEAPETEARVALRTGAVAAFICESDIALVKNGRHTVALEDFCAALEEAAGVELLCPEPPFTQYLNRYTSVSARTISGYNAKWNLKKPQFPVIRAGSVVVFQVRNGFTAPERFTVGERQNEGFGCVRLAADAAGVLREYIAKQNAPAAKEEFRLENAKAPLLRKVYESKRLTELLNRAVTDAAAFENRFNASQIGRLTLMCRESCSLEDFETRVNSIKTVSVKTRAKEIVLEPMKALCSWREAKYYALMLLTVAKYNLKIKEGK